MADPSGPNPNAPPFIPGGQAFGLGLADMGTHLSPEEHMMAMSQRAPPGLVTGCGYNRPAPPTEPPPMPPSGASPLPGLNFGLGLLGPTLGPGSLGPGLIPGPPGRQPQHVGHHPIGAGPIGAVGGAIGPAPQMGPDWGRHHPMQPMQPMQPMHNHQQLPQQLPQQTQQIPQQLQQLPMQQLPQQQQFQPKAVGTTPLPAPDAFHQERVPAPELVQAPEPVKSAALPREAPPLEVSPEPRQERQERPEEAPERKEKEKYVPPVKRYSQGDRERLERPERTEKAEKREEKVEKVEKAEKQEKRFEAAAIERRRHSSDSWEESTPVRAAPTTPPGSAAVKMDDKENPKVRTDLIRAVFRACDTNGDDWLGETEFRTIARFYGFSGSDEKWSEEFKKLCEEKHVDPKGIGQTLFSKLLNEDAGLLATTDDLRKMLKKLEDINKKTGASKEAAKAQGAVEEGDEFFHKLKRTVNWYNKHGNLTDPIRLSQVQDILCEIKPNQAMKILYDLDTAKDKESLQDPTNWIIAEAKKRRQANEQPKGKGDGKGEDKDIKTNHKNDGKTEKPDAVPEWRSQDATNDKNAKGAATKGASKGKTEEAEEETDQFRAKMKRTINWYNRHGHLCAPIRFQEVITTLGSTDPRVAMRILNDLDQANAEAVLSDPTKWIIEECRRRAPGAPGDKGAPNSQNAGTKATDVPQPKPLALSKLGGLTAVPTRLGPPKKDTAAATVPAATP